VIRTIFEYAGGAGLIGFILIKGAPSRRKQPFHW